MYLNVTHLLTLPSRAVTIHLDFATAYLEHEQWPIRVAVFVIDVFDKVKGRSTQNWRWIFPPLYVDDGKKSNSQSSRMITKRKNVDDKNSHSNGPNEWIQYCGQFTYFWKLFTTTLKMSNFTFFSPAFWVMRLSPLQGLSHLCMVNEFWIFKTRYKNKK